MTLAHPLLGIHFKAAEILTELAGEPLVAARLAHRLGEPELARALLGRTGGLFDQAESERLLNDPCPPALVAEAAARLPGRVTLPKWTETQLEMYVRVLASMLLTPAPPEAHALGGPLASWPAGLWRVPPCPEQPRWKIGFQLVERAPAPSDTSVVPGVSWAAASWGGRFGLQRQLGAAAFGSRVELISLEHVMNALNAAWRWDLPDLAHLLTRPLLIEGLETLPPDRLDLLTSLLADAATLFGWSVVALPGFDLHWPDEYGLLPLSEGHQGSSAERPTAQEGRVLLPRQPPVPLHELAAELRRQPGRSLVVLYSRASAARLAGMLPGSVLLSSSLSRLHLAERLTELAEHRATDPTLTVIATTLPSTAVGLFDQVWHLKAPLPYLIEAAPLSRATFRILDVSDVAVPPQWTRPLQVTDALLARGDALNDRALQRLYFEELRALERRSRAPHWLDLRRDMQFASLASEVNAQPEASVPVLIARDEAGQQVIERYRQERWLPRQSLKHAAWLTVSEARRAVQRGEAEDGGWALIWHGPYHPEYGLAWPHVQAAQQAE